MHKFLVYSLSLSQSLSLFSCCCFSAVTAARLIFISCFNIWHDCTKQLPSVCQFTPLLPPLSLSLSAKKVSPVRHAASEICTNANFYLLSPSSLPLHPTWYWNKLAFMPAEKLVGPSSKRHLLERSNSFWELYIKCRLSWCVENWCRRRIAEHLWLFGEFWNRKNIVKLFSYKYNFNRV